MVKGFVMIFAQWGSLDASGFLFLEGGSQQGQGACQTRPRSGRRRGPAGRPIRKNRSFWVSFLFCVSVAGGFLRCQILFSGCASCLFLIRNLGCQFPANGEGPRVWPHPVVWQLTSRAPATMMLFEVMRWELIVDC